MRLYLFFAILLIGIAACDSGKMNSKHGMDIAFTQGETYPLGFELSDVQAGIVGDKYFDFVGFKVSADANITAREKTEEGWILTYDVERFSVDSVYEFDLLERPQSAVGLKITNELTENIPLLEVGNTGELAFTGGIKACLQAFTQDVSTDDSLTRYYEDQFQYMENSVKSLYSFPGKFTKGLTWQDEFTLSTINAYGRPQEETITMDWELLRTNEKEVTFFGRGKSSFEEEQFKSEDEVKIDMKRQFGVNLVMDKSNFWIKRGNIDIRQEKGIIAARDSQLVRIPVEVRNIKVKLNPIK